LSAITRYSLPEDIDPAAIKASAIDGQLVISMLRKETATAS